MADRAGRTDVLVDLRCLQDPLYADRGIGSHAGFLIDVLRERSAGRLRIVGLVDPVAPPLHAAAAEACDEVRGAFVADALDSHPVFLALSPMTHDTTLPARLLDRPGIRSAAVVYDFIPAAFPDRYLADRQTLFRYAAACEWLSAYDVLFPISAHAAGELGDRFDVAADRIQVTGVALREAFGRRLAGAAGRRPAAARDETVLFVGGPDDRKNLDVVVAAYRELHARGRRPQFVVAGGYPEDWQRRVRSACGHAADRLVFLDRLDDEELADWHGHARATVIASRAEGFSLPVIEAIASGGLAIASDIPVHRELLDDAGARFAPDRADQLAAVIRRVLDSPAERERLRLGQRPVAERFTAAAVGDRFWRAFSCRFLASAAARRRPAARRPAIALVTPFPPDRTGVADYSLRCVEALAAHVDVDVFTEQPLPVATPAVRRFHPISAAAWLRPDYDATIAVVGNSSFHCRTIELQRRFGGPCIVHDNRLAELTAWWRGADHLRHLAERSLGRGVAADEVSGWLADPGQLPTLFYDEIIDSARPLFVHSRGIQEHVRRLYHVAAEYLPFCTSRAFDPAALAPAARAEARRALGIPADDCLIVSLGIVDAVKSPDTCVDAIARLEQCGRRARLLFVGECPAAMREALEHRAAAAGIAGRVTFSASWLDEQDYRRHIVAADAGVQLRSHFFGGLSGALMDCIAAGLPTVANEDLAAAVEAPDYVARVPDRPSATAVADGLAVCLGRGIDRRHEEERRRFVGAHGFDAYARRLLDATLGGRRAAVAAVVRECPRVFVDASYTGSTASPSGVGRVVGRSWEAIREAAARRGWQPHRVAARSGRFVALEDAAVTVTGPRFRDGDVLILPDASWACPAVWPAVERARAAGAICVPVVYDLIPLQHPEIYGAAGARAFRGYVTAVMRHADLVATISETVAAELAAETRAERFLRGGPAIVPWRLGCDFPVPTGPVRSVVRSLFLDRRPESAYLVLGAIETRKNHRFVLEAFRRLWAAPATAHVRLAVIGRPGHGSGPILEMLRGDARFGDRLVLLDDCDDAEVDHAYRHARGLVFASLAEGFGLPIVEALRHGQAVFASDLPIHREVGRSDCTFFRLDSAADLAAAVTVHEARHAAAAVPPCVVQPPLTWQDAADRLLDMIADHRGTGVRRHAG